MAFAWSSRILSRTNQAEPREELGLFCVYFEGQNKEGDMLK